MSAIPHRELLEQLERLERRYSQLEQKAAAQAGSVDKTVYKEISKSMSELRETATLYRDYRRLEKGAKEVEAMARTQGEREIREMAVEEGKLLRGQMSEILQQLSDLWLARNQEPERPLIMELRAGTGGLEASLFVGDLYRMYTKYAAKKGLSVEVLESQPSEAGGLKEMIFAVKGTGAWASLKYESGVHRVQRVPQTEAQGRIHTSTVTVAVLLEPEEVELPPISNKDLQIDVYRSSGPGGQGVNTTDSAVRIRHIPTGLVVTCQDERSQMRNKEKAMRVLRARLLDKIQRDHKERIASDRRSQVGTGERSEKIRTYNFPDRRVTDHRVGLTLHKLDQVLEGELQPLLDVLRSDELSRALKEDGA